jgi:hypothetical protein
MRRAFIKHSFVSCKYAKEISRRFSTTTLPPDYVKGSTTHFGFEEVPISAKEDKVKDVFKNVADNYDVMNDFMSGGLHRLWKDELLNMTGVKSIAKALRSTKIVQHESSGNPGDRNCLLNILDVAGGTGMFYSCFCVI